MKQIFLFFLFSLFVVAKSQTIKKDQVILVDAAQVKGTFQFEVTNKTYMNVNLTYELLEKIQSLRRDAEVVYFPISENCKVKIFPLRQLDSLRIYPPAEYIFSIPSGSSH
jgi:hypothetical protein